MSKSPDESEPTADEVETPPTSVGETIETPLSGREEVEEVVEPPLTEDPPPATERPPAKVEPDEWWSAPEPHADWPEPTATGDFMPAAESTEDAVVERRSGAS